jgi:hypothetical protein
MCSGSLALMGRSRHYLQQVEARARPTSGPALKAYIYDRPVASGHVATSPGLFPIRLREI